MLRKQLELKTQLRLGTHYDSRNEDMPAASTLGYAGWAFFGVLVRGLQLGIQQKPFSANKLGYVYSAGFWSAVGYYFYQGVDKTDEILEGRVKQLHDARARRQARLSQETATSASGA